MSVRCRLGFHKVRDVTVPLPAPERRIAYIPMPGHLWQHPMTWPVARFPYTATEEIIGYKCVRCEVVLPEPEAVQLAKFWDKHAGGDR